MPLLKPTPDCILDPTLPGGDAAFLALFNEGPGACQVRDYVSGALSDPDPAMRWGALPASAPLYGPFLDNTGASRASCRFAQSGPLLAHPMFRGNWSDGFTTCWLGLPGSPKTFAYIGDNQGGIGNPLNFGAYLSSPTKPGCVGETVRNGAGQVITAALGEYPFAAGQWIAHVRVMLPGPSGGEYVYTNLDPSGLATPVLRLAVSIPTADCRCTVGPNPIGGINASGVWGTVGLVASFGGFGYLGFWPGAKNAQWIADWWESPCSMMRPA